MLKTTVTANKRKNAKKKVAHSSQIYKQILHSCVPPEMQKGIAVPQFEAVPRPRENSLFLGPPAVRINICRRLYFLTAYRRRRNPYSRALAYSMTKAVHETALSRPASIACGNEHCAPNQPLGPRENLHFMRSSFLFLIFFLFSL